MPQTDNPDPPDNQPLPGTVISPGNSSGESSQAAPAPPPPPVPVAPPAQATPSPAQDTPELPAGDESLGSSGVKWTASEFVAHEKSLGWYGLLLVATVALSGLVYLLNKDFISVGVILLAGLVLGVYAGHRPRQLEYRLSEQGLSIGQKYYGYNQFKSFSISDEGAFSAIVLMPLKRFAPAITMYYAPDDEDIIAGILSTQLPMEEHHPDAVDSLMRRIRF